MTIQANETYGDSRSPIRADIQNSPRNLRKHITHQLQHQVTVYDVPFLVPVENSRRNRAHVRARTYHEEDDE